MAVELSPNTDAVVVRPRVIDVPANRLDEFIEAVNIQFPNLIQKASGPYQQLYAAQTDPAGNITVYSAKRGVCPVTLTGALTTIAWS